METGVEISRKFCAEVILPFLERTHPDLVGEVAIGALGTGSDTVGLDDTLSRDHHWGPRCNILLPNGLFKEGGEALLESLKGGLPKDFKGFPISFPKFTRGGVSVESFGAFLLCFAKREAPPQTEMDWFQTTEADLFHLTRGTLFHDPAREFTCLREAFAYYPDNVWKKKIADWCLYYTGSASPYNVNRCARRGDFIAAEVFFGHAVKRAMELCFLLNRTYAPYTKWLPRLLPSLPRLGSLVEAALMDAVAASDWHKKILALIRVAHAYAHELHGMGLTPKPTIREFDETFADLTLYESALALYKQVPDEMLHAKFNETEWWERLAREVLFDADDYFQKRVRG